MLKCVLLICIMPVFCMALPQFGGEEHHVGDIHSDAYYLHNYCTENVPFDNKTFDSEGYPNDLDSKCYLHCVLGTIGVIDANEKLFVDVLLPGINYDDENKLSSKCGRMRGTNICDTAYKIAKCLITTDSDYVCQQDVVKCNYSAHLLLLLTFHWRQ
uniref:CSON010849 protein n=1 Tax=Culicoides sonorensis TaxID=179676 RepID=A0A336LM48_CULSO